MLDQPLSGVKVLDLTHHIPGPFCTKLLAGFGAEVIKVERPDGGDVARTMGPFLGDVPHPEKSGLFLHLNLNKLGITLDLKSQTGQKIVKELVKDAHILVENFRPGVMASLGLSYEELCQINPNLIMTSITNFGQNGPYRDYLMTELTLYAMGGKMNRTGYAGREPIKLPLDQNLCQAGNCAAMATNFALYGREFADMGGQHIDVSIYETAMASYNTRMPMLLAYAFHGERGVRAPLAGAGGYPSDWYPTQDGYVNISGSSIYFPRVAAMLGRPELANDPRYTGLGQFDPEAKAEFESTIWFPWLMERTKFQVLEEAQKFEILSGVYSTIDDVVGSDQFNARGYFVEADHPVAGKFKYLGAPFGPYQAADDWWRMGRPAPLLGQHNEDIYCGQLGYTKEDLGRLRERGVI